MALSARTKEKSGPMNGLPCSIGEVYRTVEDNPAELAELNAILYEEGNTQRQVYNYLVNDGGYDFQIGFQSVNRHRGKDCRCFKYAPFRFCDGCKRDKPSCVCAKS